ncbi:hypothetical protein J7431_19135 [Xanthomonas phaseoli pv. dieffenbachiae]|nr:hypothetical protein [Xanthomonas phaseoli pv. dieffenbachiae]
MEVNYLLARIAQWWTNPRHQRWLLFTVGAFLVVNLVVLIGYLFVGYQNYFHTDASTKNLLAQEILETGHFFPPDWNYANRDLMVVFGQVFILPLLAFLPNNFLLHAISGLIFSLAILVALWKLTGLVANERWLRVCTLAIIAGGISTAFAENIFGQVAYGAVLLLSIVVILLAWKTMLSEGHSLFWNASLLMIVVTLATWNNPQRALISYVIPLIGSAIVQAISVLSLANVRQRLIPVIWLLATTLVGTVVGSVLSSWIISQVQNSNGVASARWLSYDDGVHNLVESVQGVMAMFGGMPVAGSDVLSVEGIYQAVRLVCAVILVVLVPAAIYRRVFEQNAAGRFVAVFTALQGLSCLFLFVATTIPDMSDPVTSSRYLAPSVILGLVLLYTSTFTVASAWRGALVGVTMLVLISNNVMRPNKEAMPLRNHQVDRAAIVEALRANGLKYGYATYWNSGLYTVLSGQDSRIRQVLIIDGLPIPMRHLGSNRWYEADAWSGPSFLLLDKVEAEKVNWDAMRLRIGAVERRIPIGKLVAYVYPSNIAAKLPNWSREFKYPVTYPAVPGAMYNQGHWDDSKKAVVSKIGESGFIAYGPYIHLPKGKYRAEFALAASGVSQGTEVAMIDVVSNSATFQLAKMSVKASAENRYSLEFTLNRQAEILEIRTFATGMGELEYRGVTLIPLSANAE